MYNLYIFTVAVWRTIIKYIELYGTLNSIQSLQYYCK